MYRRFFNVNTENAIKIFDAGGLKVTRAVPEKHIINFFWPYLLFYLQLLEIDDQDREPSEKLGSLI